MTHDQRPPLSEEEIEFLVQLANGNALSRQRRRERDAARRRQARQRRHKE
ncbi:hypothetical protein SAMN05192555_102402 [Franzmannia pantelleriensis]|uniref:Uncharacterized protein n=1 Tax=Franzmannia pantelleriensis TaxID=48727 RepID=A0A1G9HAA2_9GAMM|nr:hypothetical protein [Halomonas pantelleriensis]SDL09850.1 hypothetical protein SAMN05192555_102402 [Halomonas pantelleriensis]